MTLIMVTHEMRFAREVGDKLAFMHHGKVHEIGDPKALFAAPQTEELSNFIGSVNAASAPTAAHRAADPRSLRALRRGDRDGRCHGLPDQRRDHHALPRRPKWSWRRRHPVNLFEGRAWHAPIAIGMLERHPLGSQAFYPVDGGRMLIVVAPPGDLDESQIRAFISAPDQGVNYARGTWHHPLLCLQHPGRFLVVDRGGEGHNCDEQLLKQPLSVLNLR
ncbi:ureidoglycolate lyase [Ectopseudomonas oleovorans]|uniref:ureidoglycolate lyase n=1 Tax=Ectopseudomonas oleovorans TaxID=301 RepID=UPI003F1A0533